MGDENDALRTEHEMTNAEIRAALEAIRGDVAILSDDIEHLARGKRIDAGDAAIGLAAAPKSQIEDCGRSAEERVRRQIQENPLFFALVLTAFGYVLGSSRRLRR